MPATKGKPSTVAPTTPPKQTGDQLTEIKEAILKRIDGLGEEISEIKAALDEFKDALTSIKKTADLAFTTAKNNETLIHGSITDIEQMKTNMNTLLDNNKTLTERNNLLEERIMIIETNINASVEACSVNEQTANKITCLETELEDVKNRSMRSTLIFKNIPGNEKSWDETTSILIENLAYTTDKIKQEINANISRAHRLKGNTTKDGPKSTICSFSNWRFADRIKRDIIASSIAKKTKIIVDQKFSPQLTERRNQALLRRKDLMKDQTKQIYLDYPAKLMVKKKGSNEKYVLLEEF